ncbi:hypothetical protein C8R43DRAFT_1142547 [Mycena crocata]|nr:hypothetical protein C8R43DRAFT_1142547 [Mycena crocata]
MQFLTVLLAAATAAFAQNITPTVSSFGAAGCAGTALATWTGVPENAFCQATPGAISLDVTPGTSTRCEIDTYKTSNCDGTNGNFIATVPLADACYTSDITFGSVRILCITTG